VMRQDGEDKRDRLGEVPKSGEILLRVDLRGERAESMKHN